MKKSELKKAVEQARKKPESTKARSLKAAEEIFATKGYDGTRTRDIANAAKINISTLHYHWSSKEELLYAVHYNLFTQTCEFIDGLSAQTDDEDPKTALRSMLYEVFSFMADNINIPLLMQQPKLKGKTRPWADVGLPYFKILMDFIVERADLNFEPIEAKYALYCFVGAFEFFFIRPDLVKLYFDEDFEKYSEDFRRKAADALATMLERFGRAD